MSTKNQKPNVVFIVLDTHRVDRLGCYGYDTVTSPNLDAFAQNSTLFEKAISPAQWTIPSHASMFTGEYPSAHNTIQASDAISENFQTIIEFAEISGYQTIGLCNNPLIGVLDNGFRRGFQQFYNYGGTVPSTPSKHGSESQTLFSKVQGQYLRLIDRIATPIQQAVAASPDVLKIALNPLLVPLWTRYSNFKGDTEASIQDTNHFLQSTETNHLGSPQFIFLNLMETHLPYTPPKRFIQKFAPIVLDDPDAQDFMRVYNTKALQWLLPLEKPYPRLETQTLHQMYDAEVAYQDHLLGQLLTTLDRPEHQENTLVIIVSDHGEMLGEHQIMGHGLGVHEELVHVPLIIRFPGQTKGVRRKGAVSTSRIFHTILNEMGIEIVETPYGETISTKQNTLRRSDSKTKHIFSEAFTPENLIIILEKFAPHLIDQFHCRATRWAVYNQPYKLIRTENIKDDIFDYYNDPKEVNNLSSDADHLSILASELDDFLITATTRGIGISKVKIGSPEDEGVSQRLRNLGYIE
jgi:uncharacterized sulfatase